MSQPSAKSSPARTVARVVLGAALVFAGSSHLTFARRGFQAQVPRRLTSALPFDADDVVLMSGIVEMGLGSAILTLPRERVRIGLVAAGFFTAIFPGNLSQFLKHDAELGLDTDAKRATRLVLQPLLVLWALWSCGVV